MSWNVKEIAGAYLPMDPPHPSWHLLNTILSDNQETLVRIYEMSLGFRVLIHHKRSGAPDGLIGDWWINIEPVGATTAEEAMRIAQNICADIHDQYP